MNKNGFTLVELIIALGLAAIFLPALVLVFSFSLGSASQGESYTQAYTLAQERMESIYFLKEDVSWDWVNFPSNNGASDFYQPYKNSGVWELGSKTTTPLETDGYTVTVQILPVNRSAGDITEEAWGVLDPKSRKVNVKVVWSEKGSPTEINLVSYVTDH